jgi:acyl-CoA thioester hydrolase
MEERGYKIPVVEAHVEYKGEVQYDDLIVVRVWVSEMRRASIRFDYEIINTTAGKTTTTGYTWHVLIGSARKAITMPPDIREWLTRDPTEFETVA